MLLKYIIFISLPFSLIACSSETPQESCEYYYGVIQDLRDSSLRARDAGDLAAYRSFNEGINIALDTMPDSCK